MNRILVAALVAFLVGGCATSQGGDRAYVKGDHERAYKRFVRCAKRDATCAMSAAKMVQRGQVPSAPANALQNLMSRVIIFALKGNDHAYGMSVKYLKKANNEGEAGMLIGPLKASAARGCERCSGILVGAGIISEMDYERHLKIAESKRRVRAPQQSSPGLIPELMGVVGQTLMDSYSEPSQTNYNYLNDLPERKKPQPSGYNYSPSPTSNQPIEFIRNRPKRRTTIYQQIGNTMYGSDGSTYQRVGNTVYSSDGRSCTTVGNSVHCN